MNQGEKRLSHTHADAPFLRRPILVCEDAVSVSAIGPVACPSAQPRMPSINQVVVFTLEARRFGVPLSVVDRIIRLIEYHPLPRAPEVVAGVIDFQGAILPLIELRRRFLLPTREPRLSDQLVLVRTARRRLALLVDQVDALSSVPMDDWVPAASILPRTDYLAGAVKTEDGLILIHDIDACLSLDEEHALDLALAAPPRP